MTMKIFGKIKWFKKSKGYGYIIGADNESYFFELIDCVQENIDFKPNDEVMFIPQYGKLFVAHEVIKVGDKSE